MLNQYFRNKANLYAFLSIVGFLAILSYIAARFHEAVYRDPFPPQTWEVEQTKTNK